MVPNQTAFMHLDEEDVINHAIKRISCIPHCRAMEKFSIFHNLFLLISFEIKFKYSEKATKIRPIFQLWFDATR